ncbi:hypothetical protein B5X24_HaOG201435 [Helicoverpa armigera]|nr:hypothetical protein B5X24_HaOG201435 [Helicoverpa armigera]
MPQVFQVLRCYKCLVFQVHQTKKSNKWECKLCGEKQSIKRHYGIGTAKDCRLHVQKLNGMRGELDGLKNESNNSDSNETEENIEPVKAPVKNNYSPLKNSKWSNYVEETENVVQNSDEKMSLGDAEVVLEIPQKRRKRFQNVTKKYPKTTPSNHVGSQENLNDQIALPETRPIASNCTVSFDQKTSDLSSHSKHQNEVEPFKSRNSNKKFVPPIVNKNSKWAQFTDDADQSQQSVIEPSQSIETSQNNVLFSLCDDTDLDNILDF